jgi:predicted amidophosphoribosyltransferase
MAEEDKKLGQEQWRETIRATCPSCGEALPGNTKFCPSCGAAVKQTVFCGQCGAKLTPGTKFCPECGAKVEPKS